MNVVLIGMPGSGKSTVGVLLAKALLFDFIDTDLILQNKAGKSLVEIIDEIGIEGFKALENKVLSEIKCTDTVIATGGSAVYGEDAMNNLKANGITVYLKLPVEDIKARIHNISTRGIAMDKGVTIDELYLKRSPLYEKYADITVDCTDKGIEETVEIIKRAVVDFKN